MAERPLLSLRKICLAFPSAAERVANGEPTFRIKDKIFCAFISRDDHPALSCKAPPGSQQHLVRADPGRLVVPRVVARFGWVGMWLDGKVDWSEVQRIVARSYDGTEAAPSTQRGAECEVVRSCADSSGRPPRTDGTARHSTLGERGQMLIGTFTC